MAKAKDNPAEQAPQPDALAQNVRDAVEKWYRDNMHNTVVSRDIDVHNLIHEAKPALVEAVVAAVRQQVPNQE